MLAGLPDTVRPMSHAALPQPDSPQAWRRLLVTLVLMTIGSAGMYVVSVMLPSVQAEFGATRAEASLPYTLQMIGFGFGCLISGRLSDRFGLVPVVLSGAASLGLGCVLSGLSGSIVSFAIVQGLLVGMFGAATSFVPLVADTSLWFVKRRGIAVAVCASGNYVAGAIDHLVLLELGVFEVLHLCFQLHKLECRFCVLFACSVQFADQLAHRGSCLRGTLLLLHVCHSTAFTPLSLKREERENSGGS